MDQPYALLATAGLAGDRALSALTERLCHDEGPIFLDEIHTIIQLPRDERALLSEARRDHTYTASPARPDAWQCLADSAGYTAFARRALETALERALAIQAGDIPYVADQAFTGRETDALGTAARMALFRDEPWLPALLDRLLPAISVAPTAAKTLPSQRLLYELARAGEEFPTPELVTGLRTVRSVVRHAGVPKQLDRMLRRIEAALAERTEVALRLPRSGFGEDGTLRSGAGDYTGVVTVTDSARLVWEKDGRPLRSVPAPVRRDHAGLVKELRALVKRVNVQLGTLTRALECGRSAGTAHPYAWWRTELADHPLARTVVRRLIWEVETAPGEWRAVLPEVQGLPEAPDGASVRLWHPIRATPDAVCAWRDVLLEQEVRQPFKQAFREVYLLTPAEEETHVYSNRFAAHIVDYQRMFALFRARGWKSGRLGPWDGGDEDTAKRTLAAGQWRVDFHHSFADWTDVQELASTDQVRFRRRAGGVFREAPLAEVPPLVFSEAMRDVDLFVGVASIAADAEWTDRGEARNPGIAAYWRRTTFGELTETAEARRDALRRVLPRLRIAGRCSIDGRHLVVRGDLRTYRIHIGSANILMEPDDSYLCIVPSRGAGRSTVFLPFEDDRLSLILSKAFLLADDTKITDETILQQIARGA